MRPCLVLLAAVLAGPTACLAYHRQSLRALSAGPVPCAASDIRVEHSRTALGATFWRASCGGRAFDCAARHNYDGPTQVVCRPPDPPASQPTDAAAAGVP